MGEGTLGVNELISRVVEFRVVKLKICEGVGDVVCLDLRSIFVSTIHEMVPNSPVAPDILASSITLFLHFDFGQVPRRNFLQFFPFLVHCCFCFTARIFIA